MAYSNYKFDFTQNQIRLLHLSPGAPNDSIHCHFSLVSLDENPCYEALSYAWGNSDDKVEIIVEGRSLPITTNLNIALTNLRIPDRVRTLWVDALCIDQADLSERTHQVRRMKSIYEQASQVVVWLGEEWDGSGIAIDFLEKLGENGNLHLDASLSPHLVVGGLTLASPELSGYIIRFFATPWWTRTWTVQEFALSRDLVFQCGKRLLARHLISAATTNFWYHFDICCPRGPLVALHPPLNENVTHAFNVIEHLDYVSRAKLSLLHVVSMFNSRLATDSRDKIYGLLGLGTGQYSNIIDAKYEATPRQVCEEFALRCVERTGKLHFLSHVLHSPDSRLPSFMPNWTGEYPRPGFYRHRIEFLDGYNSSLNTTAKANTREAGKLFTRGKIYDSIATRISSNSFTSFNQYIDKLHALSDVHILPAESVDDNIIGGPKELALALTLCGDMEYTNRGMSRSVRKAQPAPRQCEILRRWKIWRSTGITHPNTSHLYDAEISRYDRMFGDITHGRTFIKTWKGHIGFAPDECTDGDLVVVLAGGTVPYVIRPVPRTEGVGSKFSSYTFVGDCYIHGIMYGEVFESPDNIEREMEEIVLF